MMKIIRAGGLIVYYELTVDIFYDIGIGEPKDLSWDFVLIDGNVINKNSIDNPFVFTTNGGFGDKLPDFWDAGFPAMSKKFVELLEGAGVDNLQKFPAIVKSEKDGTVWQEYFLVNILGIIKCADFEKSVYTEIFPGNYSFGTLAIHAEKANGSLIFRLQESPATILIHKSIGKHIGKMDPNRELVGWAAKKVIQ